MKSIAVGGTHIIKIERGELVLEKITQYCREQKIENATFTGIGAVDSLTCGYYALAEKKYYMTEYTDLVEVVSLTGNVLLKDDQPFIHAHGVFTDTTNQAFGGHIKEMRVGVVLEVVLHPLQSVIKRVDDHGIGLALMDLPPCA